MPVYIEKLMVTSTNRPTNRVNIGQSAFFRKLENRKKAEIWNRQSLIFQWHAIERNLDSSLANEYIQNS